MARDDVKRYIKAFEADRRLLEELRMKAAEGADLIMLHLDAAKAMGLDFTSDELEAELMARAEALTAQLEAAELSEEELAQVAGGGNTDCKSSYNPLEICWFSDQCTDALIFYAHNDACKSTYIKDESCIISDHCWGSVYWY